MVGCVLALLECVMFVLVRNKRIVWTGNKRNVGIVATSFSGLVRKELRELGGWAARAWESVKRV